MLRHQPVEGISRVALSAQGAQGHGRVEERGRNPREDVGLLEVLQGVGPAALGGRLGAGDERSARLLSAALAVLCARGGGHPAHRQEGEERQGAARQVRASHLGIVHLPSVPHRRWPVTCHSPDHLDRYSFRWSFFRVLSEVMYRTLP